LCGNPDWDFLLSQDLDILSLDVYTNKDVFPTYITSIKRFLDRGGILAWGIVPTNVEPFETENLASLADQLESVWKQLADKGVDMDQMLSQSLISPATCCLVNPDKEKTVEKGFALVKKLSEQLREKWLHI
jgi:hypothetical protein